MKYQRQTKNSEVFFTITESFSYPSGRLLQKAKKKALLVTIATDNRFSGKTKAKQIRKTIATAIKRLVTSLVINTNKVSKRDKARHEHNEYSQ